MTITREAPTTSIRKPFASLAAALFLAVSATTQIDVVTLYEHSFFGGQSVNIILQTIPSHAPTPLSTFGFDDDTTSLTWDLQPNTSVTLYENSDGSGDQWHITYNQARNSFATNIGAQYNDTWSAISWQYDDPSVNGTVTLYQTAGWVGPTNRLALSNFQEGALTELYGFDDETTALQWDLAPNVIVTFYENINGTGREYTINHTTPTGQDLLGAYNNTFSSFRWHNVTPAQGWMNFYTSPGFGGFTLTRYVSMTGFAGISMAVVGYNDEINGVEWGIPLGTSVLLYDHNPAGGACHSLTGVGQRDFGNAGFADRLSVIEVLNGDFAADMSDRNLPYDQNTYLASNNAYASQMHGWNIFHQDLSVRAQLEYGARALHLDTFFHASDFHLASGSWTTALSQRGGVPPETLDSMLATIEVWMNAHPREVLTLIFENWDGPELGDHLLDTSIIKDKIHVQQRGSWPTLNELLAAGKRYVVFETRSSPRSNRIPWLHDNCVENDVVSWNDATPHPASQAIDSQNRGLFHMNNVNATPPSQWLPGTNPNAFAFLFPLMNAFAQHPNFVAVDRISVGGEGGADAVRYANTTLAAQNAGRATYAAFGSANCGERTLQASNRPVLGTSLLLTLSKPPAGNGAFELLLFGHSDQLAGAASLPLVVPAFGAGCTLRVSSEISLGLGFVSYPHPVSVSLPASASLVGVDGYFQTLGFDFVGGEYVMSDAGRAHLGSN